MRTTRSSGAVLAALTAVILGITGCGGAIQVHPHLPRQNRQQQLQQQARKAALILTPQRSGS